MTRWLFVVPALLLATGAQAQQGQRQDPGCARDVQRFCRAQINDGDMVILSCLQEHRARLSRACAKALADNGR